MDFLKAVKEAETARRARGDEFPDVRLSVVDTSAEEFVPASGRTGYARGTFPVPDFAACRGIAGSFGWPLVIKLLFRDSRDDRWNDRSYEALCVRGVSPDMCRNCSYRH